MKPSASLLLPLASPIALAATVDQAVSVLPVQDTHPTAVPQVQLHVENENAPHGARLPADQIALVADTQPQPQQSQHNSDNENNENEAIDQWPAPRRGKIGLGQDTTDTMTMSAGPSGGDSSSTPAPMSRYGLNASLRARSEGTLGQTPWVGMAIGLTFTALAAVMLG